MTGYDLTVPGPYTFATASGVFVQDSMNVHVPVSDDAVREIKEKLMPSQNLFDLKRFEAQYLPSQEAVGGIHNITGGSGKEKPVVKFKTREEAMKAYHEHKIDLDQRVEIAEEKAA